MRRLLLLATIMLIPSAGASAQALDPASSCWSLATKGEVVVTRTDGTSVKDTVLTILPPSVLLVTARWYPSLYTRDIPMSGVSSID